MQWDGHATTHQTTMMGIEKWTRHWKTEVDEICICFIPESHHIHSTKQNKHLKEKPNTRWYRTVYGAILIANVTWVLKFSCWSQQLFSNTLFGTLVLQTHLGSNVHHWRLLECTTELFWFRLMKMNSVKWLTVVSLHLNFRG